VGSGLGTIGLIIGVADPASIDPGEDSTG